MTRISKHYEDKALSDLLRHVSKNLKAFREARGWSQNQLAKKAGGVAISTISEIEGGLARDIRFRTLTSLSRALGRDPVEFMVHSDLKLGGYDKKALDTAVGLLDGIRRRQQ